MPKKPFSADEIRIQRERIMDSASCVMAEVGFHHLSMRKLAMQLGMTASNIYNYFPSKEMLFLQTRQRGFKLLFERIRMKSDDLSIDNAEAALTQVIVQLISFAQQHPGYYQLMFQPPQMDANKTSDIDETLITEVNQMSLVWQTHLLRIISDIDESSHFLNKEKYDDPISPELESSNNQFLRLFYATLHGLIDCYRYRSLPVYHTEDNISDDRLMIELCSSWLQIVLSQPKKSFGLDAINI